MSEIGISKISAIRSAMVVGMGLIGGSVAMAVKDADSSIEVVGVAPQTSTIDAAVEAGIIDGGFAASDPRIDSILEKDGVDLVVLCVPPACAEEYFQRIGKSGFGRIVTDAVSTKARICRAAHSSLSHPNMFVPGHPMAGSEESGLGGAKHGLFEDKCWILCPDSNTDRDALDSLRLLIEAMGARCIYIPRELHDEIVALVSHVPHMAASALVELASRHAGEDGELFEIAAGGFRDTTRIAAGSPALWADIVMSNREHIAAGLAELGQIIGRLEKIVTEGDAQGMVEFLSRTSKTRRSIPASAGGLRGTATVPPDKSISHRALMMASMAEGTSRLSNLLDSQDVNSTARCLEALGASIDVTRRGGGSFDATVTGWGQAGPATPAHDLDCGNSGTTARLLLGMLSGYDVEATLVGDESLSKRPMQRVTAPLASMGARFSKPGSGEWERGEITLPISVHGSADLRGIEYASPKASAQVKTSLMFAGLHCTSTVDLSEPYQSRNHTELMLPAFGVQVEVEPFRVRLHGGQKLHACNVRVPGDPSSAMFLIVAAALTPGSNVVLEGIGLNPTRIAGIEVARRMGCDIAIEQTGMVGGEPAGNICVRHSPSMGAVVVEPQEVPNLIDEIPVLALLATSAKGITTFREVSELRVKESNRLAAVIDGLCKMGATAREVGDSLEVEHGLPHKAVRIDPMGDHRLAMTWMVANKCLGLGGEVVDPGCVDVSFPGFEDKLDALLGDGDARGKTTD